MAPDLTLDLDILLRLVVALALSAVLFVSRRGEHVKGLSTAASIWVTAAVGMLTGLERYLLAVSATILVFFILHVPAYFKFGSRKEDQGSE